VLQIPPPIQHPATSFHVSIDFSLSCPLRVSSITKKMSSVSVNISYLISVSFSSFFRFIDSRCYHFCQIACSCSTATTKPGNLCLRRSNKSIVCLTTSSNFTNQVGYLQKKATAKKG